MDADEFRAHAGSELHMVPADPATGLMALRAVGRADVAAACARLRALTEGGEVRLVACDVSALAAELAAVDALARLALLARRLGCPLRVRRASPQLRDLVELCGLTERLGVEGERQPEEREQALRVQERVDPGDAPV
jgi:hypothetical protein